MYNNLMTLLLKENAIPKCSKYFEIEVELVEPSAEYNSNSCTMTKMNKKNIRTVSKPR